MLVISSVDIMCCIEVVSVIDLSLSVKVCNHPNWLYYYEVIRDIHENFDGHYVTRKWRWQAFCVKTTTYLFVSDALQID